MEDTYVYTRTHTHPLAPVPPRPPAPNPRKWISQPAGLAMSHNQFRFVLGQKTSLSLLGLKGVPEKVMWS